MPSEGGILYEVSLSDQSLGITLMPDRDDLGAVISGFFQHDGMILNAEKLRKIALNDRIVAIQGKNVEREEFDTIMKLLRKKKRPIKITFERKPAPSNLVISWNEVLSDLNALYIYLRFLKRKRCYLCYIWMSFVIEVNRLGHLEEKERESAIISIMNTYIYENGLYSSCLYYTFPVPVSQWKNYHEIEYYFHNIKVELCNRVKSLSWMGFISSPE